VTKEIQRRLYEKSDESAGSLGRMCARGDIDCWMAISTEDILAAQGSLIEHLSGDAAIQGVPLAEGEKGSLRQ